MQKDAKETARYEWVLIVTKLFNIAAKWCQKTSVRYSRVFVVTKLVVSESKAFYLKILYHTM